MRLFRSKRDAKTYQADMPHPYQPIDDAGLAAVATGGWAKWSGGAQQVATTNRYQRIHGCAVPGCGRPPDDEIHAPPDV